MPVRSARPSSLCCLFLPVALLACLLCHSHKLLAPNHNTNCVFCAASLHHLATAVACSDQPPATTCIGSCSQPWHPNPEDLQPFQDSTHGCSSLFSTNRRNVQPATAWKLRPAYHRRRANAPWFTAHTPPPARLMPTKSVSLFPLSAPFPIPL